MRNGACVCLVAIVLLAALAVSVASPSSWSAQSPSSPISRRGVHDGVPYRIEVPAGWNGKLVVYAHGYEGEGPGPGSVGPSPLGTYLTGQGYAWAAAGYPQPGLPAAPVHRRQPVMAQPCLSPHGLSASLLTGTPSARASRSRIAEGGLLAPRPPSRIVMVLTVTRARSASSCGERPFASRNCRIFSPSSQDAMA